MTTSFPTRRSSVLSPWYPLGSHDMLEVAHMGLHVGQMTGVEEQKACFAAVTGNGARVMQLDGYGLEPGCHADTVVLQAGDVLEALRLKPARRSEEHTSELQSLMRISYAVFCLKK